MISTLRATALLLLSATVSVAAPLPVAELKRTEPVDFAREIHPVLKRNCLACHNTTKAKADLNLESPELMKKGGENGPAIVPGKSAESLLLKSAAHLDEDLVMPPPANKVKAANLTPDELGLLKLWIDQGAKGEGVTMAKGPLPWRATPVGVAAVNAVAISPDSRLVAAARGNRVALCETTTGRVLAELSDPGLAGGAAGKPLADPDAVMSAAFASDDLLATGGFRTVRLWRRMPRVVKRDFGVLAETATAIATSADGQWAAVGDAKGGIVLWNLAAEKFEPVPLKDHAASITALAFSPDGGWLVSAAEDKSLRVWDLPTRAVKLAGTAPAAVRAIAFLEAGTEVLAGCADGVVRVWPWLKELPAEIPAPLRESKLQDQPVVAVVASKGSTFVWAGADGALHLASAVDGKEQRKVSPEHPEARRVALLEREAAIAQGLVAARKAALTAATEAAKKEGENARATAQALEKARTAALAKRVEAGVAADALRPAAADKALQDAAKKSGDEAARAEAAFRAAKVNAELGERRAGEAASAQAAADATVAGAEARLAEAQAALEAGKKSLAQPAAAIVALALSGDGAQASITTADGQLQHLAMDSGLLLEPPDAAGTVALLPSGEVLADRRGQTSAADQRPARLGARTHHRQRGGSDAARGPRARARFFTGWQSARRPAAARRREMVS